METISDLSEWRQLIPAGPETARSGHTMALAGRLGVEEDSLRTETEGTSSAIPHATGVRHRAAHFVTEPCGKVIAS